MTSGDPYSAALNQAYGHALAYLASSGDGPVGATVPLEALRGRLQLALEEDGLAPERVIEDLVAGTEGGLIRCTGGRFFAWVVGGTLPAALAADWLVSAWDQNAAIHASAPAHAVIEETVGDWLKDLLRLPREASFALTTGCQMAHCTCLAAARNALLARRGWDVETRGLAGAPPIRVLAGPRHGSVDRALRFLGLGTGSLVPLELDEGGRIRPESLAHELERDRDRPTILVLSAGEINTGSYDPFAELIPVAHEAGAWVHVDGAFGLWANASDALRHLLAGVEAADSWATDGHKLLNVPFDCGYALVADPGAHHASMAIGASYIPRSGSAREPFEWNPEWSRRGRAVPTYAALRQLGRNGVADLVERCCRHARALVTGIGSLPGAETVVVSSINQGLVRFRDPRPGATAEDHDAFTDRVIAGIVDDGEAFFGGTTWRGRRCMRVSVCSWRTGEADVVAAVDAVGWVLERLAEG
jgi:glutamate/tyrosine decarboxylase-like PLP-dependent enzyme